MAHHDDVIDKLSKTGPIRRAAQLTVYYLFRFSNHAKKRIGELEKNSENFRRVKEQIDELNRKNKKLQ